MGDLVRNQRWATRGPQDSLVSAGARRVRFNQRWVAHETDRPCGTVLAN
jgi:hypothetical protein